MKRIFSSVLFCCVLFSFLFSFSAFAADKPELSEFENYIPKEAREKLPEDLFDPDKTNIENSFSFSYFTGLLKDAIASALGDNTPVFATLLALVLLASLFHSLAACTGREELVSAFSSISALAVCVYVFTSLSTLFSSVYAYLNTLASFANTVTPFITIAYAAGGNVSAAAVSSTGLLLCITLIESMNAYLLYPVLKVSSVMTIASSAAPKLRIGTLSGFIRGFLMLAIGFIVAAISAVMSFQHTLASSADSLAARAVRFAASSFIPIVGSAISDAVRTVSGSITYIRTTVGGIGIVVIVIMTLPVFVSLMLSRINLALGASLADMLGCEREYKALKEAGGLVNFLIALVSIMAVMFVYSLTLLVRCASSYGA